MKPFLMSQMPSILHLQILMSIFSFNRCFTVMIRFVSLMDGHIWIESDGPGKGCTAVFFAKLGIAEYSNEFEHYIVSKGQSCKRQTHFPGLKVLIVDGNG